MKRELTEIEKYRLNQFEESIDLLNEDISLLKKALLKDIFYFTEIYGKYKYMASFVEDKYKEILSPKDIKSQIDNLSEQNFIYRNINKSIYNGKYITIITFGLNPELLKRFNIINN